MAVNHTSIPWCTNLSMASLSYAKLIPEMVQKKIMVKNGNVLDSIRRDLDLDVKV